MQKKIDCKRGLYLTREGKGKEIREEQGKSEGFIYVLESW